MKTLLIDTHDREIELLYTDGKKEYRIIEDSPKGHSEIMVPSLEKLLKDNSIDVGIIDLIVVVVGPGSFTGVRIGVTVAKTLAYDLNIPIKTITSLEAYGVSTDEDFDIVMVEDTKGVYSARKYNGKYVDFSYRKRNDFEKYIEDNQYKTTGKCKLNMESILDYLSTEENCNPHLVNPVYIKEIDL